MSTREGHAPPAGAPEVADFPLRACLPDPGWQMCKQDAGGNGTSVAAAVVADTPDAISLPCLPRRGPGRYPPGCAARGLLADREDHRPVARVARDGDPAGGDRRSAPAVLQPQPRVRHSHRLRTLQRSHLRPRPRGVRTPGACPLPDGHHRSAPHRALLGGRGRDLGDDHQHVHRAGHQSVLPAPRLRHLERQHAVGPPRHPHGHDHPRPLLPGRPARQSVGLGRRPRRPPRASRPADLPPRPRLPDRLPG